jgi:PIN domain nuclease of toxin-antitoxin system
MSHVVDTHGLVWFLEGNARLGPNARTILDTTDETLILPATVIAEACWMIQRGKTSIPSVSAFFMAIDADTRFQIVPLDRATIEKSNGLTAITEMHDRQIVATTLLLIEKGETASLITHDSVIVASGLVPIIW